MADALSIYLEKTISVNDSWIFWIKKLKNLIFFILQLLQLSLCGHANYDNLVRRLPYETNTNETTTTPATSRETARTRIPDESETRI